MATHLRSRFLRLFGPTDDLSNPLWTLRVSPALALICLVLSATVVQNGFWHGLLLGLAIGQLVVIVTTGFSIKSVTYRGEDDFRIQTLGLNR